MKRYLRFLAQCTVAVLVLAGSAVSTEAATVTPASGDFGVAIDFAGFVPTGVFHVTADAALDVSGLGPVAASTFGAPAPNTLLAVGNAGFTEAVQVALSLAGVDPVALSFAVLGGTGTPFTAINDPALLAFLNPSTLIFGLDTADPGVFDIASGTGTLNYNFLTGEVTPAAVPEPGPMVMIGGALLFLGNLLRARRA